MDRMYRVSRRSFLKSLALIGGSTAAAGLAAACTPAAPAPSGAPGQEPAAPAAETIALSFMTWWLPPLVIGTAVEHAVAEFNQNNPGIAVKIEPNPGGPDAQLQKWQTMLAAGAPPDITLMRLHYHTAFASRGAFLQVDDLLAAQITFGSMAGQLLSCSLVAYSFARLRWSGRTVLFIMVLSTMMLPNQVTLIPTFLIFRQLGWLDTFLPMIVPAFFGGGPFLIFLMRQFFLTISTELDDAARIDGAGSFGIYWRIILPLSKPVLIACAIFSFESHWNDFFRPLIYLQSRDKFTLSLALHAFNSDYGRGTDWNLLMAASLVVMLPVILVFFFAQRYFIQGVVFSGVKGLLLAAVSRIAYC